MKVLELLEESRRFRELRSRGRSHRSAQRARGKISNDALNTHFQAEQLKSSEEEGG